jgi:hypothetical protein
MAKTAGRTRAMLLSIMKSTQEKGGGTLTIISKGKGSTGCLEAQMRK